MPIKTNKTETNPNNKTSSNISNTRNSKKFVDKSSEIREDRNETSFKSLDSNTNKSDNKLTKSDESILMSAANSIIGLHSFATSDGSLLTNFENLASNNKDLDRIKGSNKFNVNLDDAIISERIADVSLNKNIILGKNFTDIVKDVK